MMDENVAVGKATHQVNLLYASFFFSFTGATLVNKYVLSVLKFTYPTIFQGWQMLAGCIILQCLAIVGKISITPSIFNTERIAIVKWLPAVMLNVISAYAGSVALAHLPVPIFLACQNLVPVIMEFDESLRQKCVTPSLQIVINFLIIISVFMLIKTAPEASYLGYTAVFIHVITSAAYSLFDKFTTYKINLRSFERLYCNYVFSCVLFAPFSYLLGDVSAVRDFEFYQLYEFYGGCLARCSSILTGQSSNVAYELEISSVRNSKSGVIGALLNLSIVKMTEFPTFSHMTNQIMSLSKMLVAVISLSLFDIPYDSSHAFWLMITLLASLLGSTYVCETQEDGDAHHEI